MKVLVVHNEYKNRGGEDSVVRAESRLLQSAGHTALSYFRSNQEIAPISLAQKARLGIGSIWNFASYLALKKMIQRERPDVAHFHNTFPLVSPSAYAACAETGVPVVQTVHNYRLVCPGGNLLRGGHPCEKCVGKWIAWPGVAHRCYRGSWSMTGAIAATTALHRDLGTWQNKVNIFIAPSEFTRRKLIQGGFPPDRIVVKPHFVSPDPGFRTSTRAYAIFVGRLSEEKGVNRLLHSWKAAGARLPLRLIGDGPLRHTLESQCQSLGLQEVQFEGQLSHEQTINQIKRARFLVTPSECYETFSMAIAEAAACGVPAIASGHGAIAEIVHDMRTGILFDPSHPNSLTEKIKWAIRHPDEMEEFGRAAREKFVAEFTAERNLPQLLSIYSRAGVGSVPHAVAQHNSGASSGRSKRVPFHKRSEVFSVLGVRVDATQIPNVIQQMQNWIHENRTCRIIAVTGMHGVMESRHDAEFRNILNESDAVVPDGMPLVWLGRLQGYSLKRRVYGPELMLSFCENSAHENLRHFFYGGTAGQAEKLAKLLQERFPGMQIAGAYSPPFRPLMPHEDDEVTAMINRTGASVLWVGLGTPKQERWMHEHRARLHVPVVVGVGAAFDIHTGTKPQAPAWMREHGLEWMFRLVSEPRRLWRRYLVYGSEFVFRAGLEALETIWNGPVRIHREE